MAKIQKTGVNFEKAMTELETIVEEMEAGELSLEAAMAHFEKGIHLTRTCHDALQEAEQKVNMLVAKQGKFELANFETNDSEDQDDDV